MEKNVERLRKPESERLPSIFIALATAHPAKFPSAIQAAIGSPVSLPKPLAEVMESPTRCSSLSPSVTELKAFIEETLETRKAATISGRRQAFLVRVPGSCANLGSGFDVLGILSFPL